MAEAPEPEQPQQVHFTFEVLSVIGLPRPLQAAVELSGFVGEPQRTLDSQEASVEYSSLSFGGGQSITISKDLEIEDVIWRQRPRPRLLDVLAGDALIVKLLDAGNDHAEVAVAQTTLQDFIFDESDKEFHLDLQFNDEYIAAAEEGREAVESAAPIITVRIQASERIGLTHCPEDYEDWTVLSVKVDGIFSLPPKLIDSSGTLVGASPGKIEDHPFAYHFRIMNCMFENGYVVKPDVPEEENAEAGAGAAADADAPPAEGEENLGEGQDRPGTAQSRTMDEALLVDLPQFLEALRNIGYTQVDEDGPEAFKFMDPTGDGVIGMAAWCELRTLEAPTSVNEMIEIRTAIIKGFGTLRNAFDKYAEIQRDGVAGLPLAGWEEMLRECEYSPENQQIIQGAHENMDVSRNGYIEWSEFQTLHLYAACYAVMLVDNCKTWCLSYFGDMMIALQQIDLNGSGRVSIEEWVEAMQKFEFPGDKEQALAAFQFMDTDATGIVGPKQFQFLQRFDGKRFLKELQKFRNMLFGEYGDLARSFRDFLPANVQDQAIAEYNQCKNDPNKQPSNRGLIVKAREWKAACKRKGWEKISQLDPLTIFNFLDETHSGYVKESEFLLLRAFNSSAASGGVARFKNFVMEKFPDLETAFNLLFGDPSVFYETAENKLPYVEFPQKEIRLFKGREWMQQLYNIIEDPRGHTEVAPYGDPMPYGVWLYFFPRCTDHDPAPLDYRDLPPANQEMARLARHHHSQMFVELRKLKMKPGSEAVEKLEYRAHMSRNQLCPSDVNSEGTFDASPFESARTYIKLSISFEHKPLMELCPRNVAQLDPEFFPEPPGEKGPQTPTEVFESTVKIGVAKLTKEFAKACRDRGLFQTQTLGPGGLLSEYQLLGKDVRRREFLRWIKADGEGRDALQELAEEFRTSLSKVIQKEGRGVPACAMHGDERDVMYSEMWKKLLEHVVAAINSDVGVQMWRRDAKLWKHKPLYGDGDENFFEAEDLAIQLQMRDKELARLIYECEMYSAHERATVFYKEKLELPFNKKNFGQWYNYARFLMRCGQRQVEAEEALRYAISLEGVQTCDADALLFLACTFINKTGRSSVPEEERFEMAKSLFSIYLSRAPSDPVANFFFYLMYAVQFTDTGDETCRAMAAKYMVISKADPSFFTAILPSLKEDCTPNFPELDALYYQEQLARGEIDQTEKAKWEVPPAWLSAAYPVFASVLNFHAFPDIKDEAILDSIDRILLFGMPKFTRYLLTEAPKLYDFISEQSLQSERCRLQLIKAQMMLLEWENALENCTALLGEQDRNCEAWILQGELLFRCGLQDPDEEKKEAKFLESLVAFDNCGAFLKLMPPDKAEREQMSADEKTTSETEIPNRDPLVQLRQGAIHYYFAEKSKFTDEKSMIAAKEKYKGSLLLVETAEAWRNAGVCAFRLAQNAKARGDAEREDIFYAEALDCLMMANEKDNTRPKIWAWLCICSVEGGHHNKVVQSYRCVMQHAADVEWENLLELAQRFLRFSDPTNAAYEGGPKFVREGLYAREAQEMATLVLQRPDGNHGEARLVLGQSYMLQNNMVQAFVELREAFPLFDADESKQNFIADLIRRCAEEIPEDPKALGLLKQDIELAKERRKALDATRLAEADATKALDQTKLNEENAKENVNPKEMWNDPSLRMQG